MASHPAPVDPISQGVRRAMAQIYDPLVWNPGLITETLQAVLDHRAAELAMPFVSNPATGTPKEKP